MAKLTRRNFLAGAATVAAAGLAACDQGGTTPEPAPEPVEPVPAPEPEQSAQSEPESVAVLPPRPEPVEQAA